MTSGHGSANATAGYANNCTATLQAINQQAPRVHCITNAVAMNYSANMLLAVGAIPSMSIALSEIADFVSGARSLCVNIGTIDDVRQQAIERALPVAREHRKPWVLDPVLITASKARLQYAESLLEHKPTVIRANAAEVALLARIEHEAAQALAQATGSIVIQTGANDLITDGTKTIGIANGHAMMTRITALGCASSALLAAFLALESDPFEATVQAFLALGVAGEVAADKAAGPGSLQIGILDQLYQLNGSTVLQQRGRIL